MELKMYNLVKILKIKYPKLLDEKFQFIQSFVLLSLRYTTTPVPGAVWYEIHYSMQPYANYSLLVPPQDIQCGSVDFVVVLATYGKLLKQIKFYFPIFLRFFEPCGCS